MDIGDFRHRVWLQTKTESRDSEGGVIESWSTLVFMFTAIAPMSGRELEIASQTESVSDTTITVRWQKLFGYSDISKMRFITNSGQIYNVESAIEPMTAHKFIKCYCVMVTNKNKSMVLVDENHQTLFTDTNEPLLVGA